MPSDIYQYLDATLPCRPLSCLTHQTVKKCHSRTCDTGILSILELHNGMLILRVLEERTD